MYVAQSCIWDNKTKIKQQNIQDIWYISKCATNRPEYLKLCHPVPLLLSHCLCLLKQECRMNSK
jgi:hypothetical protein